MKFSVLTLFPDVITAYCQSSIIGKALDKDIIQVEAINIRDFTTDPHRKVDDSPYGGGSGMVMTCQPIDDALQALKPLSTNSLILLTTPTGRPLDHRYVTELAQCQQLIFLCGHYEGFDARINTIAEALSPENCTVEEVSLGDFVLTGGELPALCIMDAVSRLLPGVVQKFSSVESDSFFDGLLDFPHYTRPADYHGLKVPDILLSGDHQAIAQWRREQSLTLTLKKRPELLEAMELPTEEKHRIAQLKAEIRGEEGKGTL